MSAHSTIICKGGRGQQIEGVLATGSTPKPGTAISLKSDGTYEPYNTGAADGARGNVAILVEDALLGKTKTDAYADSAQFMAYIPQAGDEIQVLVASGETITKGTKLIIDKGTGKFLATTGSPQSEPFEAIEASGGALGADTHILARATGV